MNFTGTLLLTLILSTCQPFIVGTEVQVYEDTIAQGFMRMDHIDISSAETQAALFLNGSGELRLSRPQALEDGRYICRWYRIEVDTVYQPVFDFGKGANDE